MHGPNSNKIKAKIERIEKDHKTIALGEIVQMHVMKIHPSIQYSTVHTKSITQVNLIHVNNR